MRALAATALTLFLTGSQTSHQSTEFYQPISSTYRLRGIATYRYTAPGICCATELRVDLVDRRNPSRFWRIADIEHGYEITFKVERADERSIVLSQSDPDYGVDQGSLKLFFDTQSKNLLKRVDFATVQDLSFRDDAEAQATLGVGADGLKRLHDNRIFTARADDFENRVLPPPFATRPLPQSTYQEFARARPQRVKDGYAEADTDISESVGPYQEEAGRFWFGKTFYDGEGTSGVGGIGSINAAGVYQMLRIPQLFDWSVSALLVEPDTIWAGRVLHPEGADQSGGLLEYNRRSGRANVHPVPDVVTRIAQSDGALFLGTTHGVYVFRGGERRRYRMEPDIDGRMTVVAETLR